MKYENMNSEKITEVHLVGVLSSQTYNTCTNLFIRYRDFR